MRGLDKEELKKNIYSQIKNKKKGGN